MLSFNLFIEENNVTATLFLRDESFVLFFIFISNTRCTDKRTKVRDKIEV